jgi:hypothetical protein
MGALIILEGQGPLPQGTKFQSPLEGPATFVLSATAWTQSAGTLTGVSLVLDGKVIGTAMCFANFAASHTAMITTFIPVEYLSYDTHAIEVVTAYSGTITDTNDYFQVTLLY